MSLGANFVGLPVLPSSTARAPSALCIVGRSLVIMRRRHLSATIDHWEKCAPGASQRATIVRTVIFLADSRTTPACPDTMMCLVSDLHHPGRQEWSDHGLRSHCCTWSLSILMKHTMQTTWNLWSTQCKQHGIWIRLHCVHSIRT